MFKLLPVLLLGGAIAWYWQPIDGWIDPDRATEKQLPECAEDCAPRSFGDQGDADDADGVAARRSEPSAPSNPNAVFGTAPVKNGGKTSPNGGGYSTYSRSTYSRGTAPVSRSASTGRG